MKKLSTGGIFQYHVALTADVRDKINVYDVLLLYQILGNDKLHRIMRENNTFINKITLKIFYPPSGNP